MMQMIHLHPKKGKEKDINSKRGDTNSNPNSVANINKVFESSMRKQEKDRSQQLKQQKKQAKETIEYRKKQLVIKEQEITVLKGQEKVKENKQKYIDYRRYQELKATMLNNKIRLLFPHMAILLIDNTITNKNNSISNK